MRVVRTQAAWNTQSTATTNSDTYNISAAVSAVDEATRRTTLIARRLSKVPRKASVVVDTTAGACTSYIVLSDHINNNHLSEAAHVCGTSD